ncbi:MAG: hypothetical protein ACFFD4_02435 [Candidatus Odinarchaeota archaeon]
MRKTALLIPVLGLFLLTGCTGSTCEEFTEDVTITDVQIRIAGNGDEICYFKTNSSVVVTDEWVKARNYTGSILRPWEIVMLEEGDNVTLSWEYCKDYASTLVYTSYGDERVKLHSIWLRTGWNDTDSVK